MPTYSFKNTQTGEVFEEFMSISSLDVYLKDNPHLQQVISKAPALVDSWHFTKVPSGFNDVLKKVKKQNRGSTITTGNLTEV